MGRNWRRKARKDHRSRDKSADSRRNERSIGDGAGARRAVAPHEAENVPAVGQERFDRSRGDAAGRAATVDAAIKSPENAVPVPSGKVRLLQRTADEPKGGILPKRGQTDRRTAEDRPKSKPADDSTAQTSDISKIIKRDLEHYHVRTSEELLSAFIGGSSSIRQLFTSCQLEAQAADFHESVVAAIDRVIGDLFFAFRRECLGVLSALTSSIYFIGLLESIPMLALVSARCRCQLLTVLSVAVQEKIMSLDRAHCCLNALEAAACDQDHCDDGSGFRAAERNAMESARHLLRWEEESASFDAQRERDLKSTMQLMVRGSEGVTRSMRLTENERKPGECRGQRALASLLPSNFELLHGSAPPLVANKLDGRYRDADEYIDTHFFLLRENFVGPLRKAVQEYVRLSSLAAESGTDPPTRLSDARLYDNLTFVHRFPASGQFVFKVRLSHGLSRNWIGGRLLLDGSLVALSADRFETIVLATVVSKEEPSHGSGNLTLDVIRGLALVVRALGRRQTGHEVDAAYVMIESSTYYEEYRHITEALQRMNPDTLPFRHHLISESAFAQCRGTEESKPDSSTCDSVQPHRLNCLVPSYLQQSVSRNSRGIPYVRRRRYNFNCLLHPELIRIFAGRYESVDVLDRNQWPAAEHIGLDASQADALRMALCSDLAVIQGPPGTGKTHIGIAIVSMLLANCHAWSDPQPPPAPSPKSRGRKPDVIAVICYTNHALDQFLELILDRHPDSVVRLGGGSSNPMLESCNIQRLSPEFLRSRTYRSVQSQLNAVERLIAMAEARGSVGCAMGSLSLKEVSRYLDTRHVEQLRQSDEWSQWLYGHDLVKDACGASCEACTTADVANGDHGSTTSASLCEHLSKEVSATVEEARRSPLKMTCSEMLAVDDVWKLSLADRWRMYRYLAELYWQGHSLELEALAEQRNSFREQLQKLRATELLSAFQDRKIVGATVTGAIKQRTLLNLLKPKIMIVEEAAEILEANILASLTRHCEQLILIGDHQQLRPKPEMHELTLHYNFDVSLFERLVVHGGTTFTLLETQRRMRPEISKIVRRIFYNNLLQDHSSVEEREPVRGLARSVFFVQHSQRETSDGATKSFVNEFEANFAVELCRYLLRHGYKPPQITLLVPYIGQQRKLKETLGNASGVRLTTVDNYQGEENDIVILCLVRSNEEGSIGFVGTHNRICVALSRARLGFYCFGNFTWLSRKSSKWRAIVNLLTETGEIGPALPLRCHVHGQQTGCAKTPEDLSNISNGGCSVQCNAALPCGHVCQQPCHSDDPDHRMQRKCQQMCLKPCQRGLHKCMTKCSEPFSICYEQVLRSFDKCGHDWAVQCSRYDHDDVCMHPVTARRAECSRHEVDSSCHFSRCSDSQCVKPGWLRYAGEPEKRGKCIWLKSRSCLAEDVFTYPGCGHQVTVSCHVLTCTRFSNCTERISVVINGQRDAMLCQKFCRTKCPHLETKILPCNHSVSVACAKLRHGLRSYRCPTIVVKKCEGCGSEREAPCGDVLTQTDCKGIIEKKLSCGHVHKVECCNQNVKVICTELVKEPRPGCRHLAERRCCDGKNTKPCMELVDRVLDCKHSLKVPCSSSHEAVPRCEVSRMEKLVCGHYLPILCYDRKNIPMCQSLVKVTRVTCKHEVIVPCHAQRLPLPACTTNVEVKMPNCGHTVHKPCSQPVESLLCDKVVAKPLGCGHKKKLKCYEAPEDVACQKLVARRSPCGHAAKVSCHAMSCKMAQCDVNIRLHVDGFPALQGLCHEIRGHCSVKVIRRLALCGHEVNGECSESPSDLVCDKPTQFRLPCDHLVSTLCHVVRCEGCDRTVSSGHQCRTLKSKLSVCLMEANLRRPCGHTSVAVCHVTQCAVDDCRTTIVWQDEEMPCGRLRAAALAAECHAKIRMNLPCGHNKDIDCCEAQDCQCDDRCGGQAEKPNTDALDRATTGASRALGICQVHACEGYQTRQLDCGHAARVQCRDRLLPVRCNKPIADVVTLCGHSALRACGDGTSSKPICTAERCEIWCMHGGCQMRCAEPCMPCTKPCARCGDDFGGNGCGHRPPAARSSRYKHLCFQPCRLAFCSFPCSRPLPCGHECRGLCGEACPALCLACPGPLLERVCRRYGVGPSERFLRLAPCNDVVPVSYMDGHVNSYRRLIDAGNGDIVLKPLLCPSCRSPVGCCYRYDEVIKRYFNLKRKVPPGSGGEWIACPRGHVRRREEQGCRRCMQLQLRRLSNADPTRRRLPVGLPVRFRCAPEAIQQLEDRDPGELDGVVYYVCSDNDDEDDDAEIIVRIRRKFVVTVAGNVFSAAQ